MRARKIIAAGMVAVMCAGLMTGCGSNDTKSQFKKFSKCATIDKAGYRICSGIERGDRGRCKQCDKQFLQ